MEMFTLLRNTYMQCVDLVLGELKQKFVRLNYGFYMRKAEILKFVCGVIVHIHSDMIDIQYQFSGMMTEESWNVIQSEECVLLITLHLVIPFQALKIMK